MVFRFFQGWKTINAGQGDEKNITGFTNRYLAKASREPTAAGQTARTIPVVSGGYSLQFGVGGIFRKAAFRPFLGVFRAISIEEAAEDPGFPGAS